MARKYRKTIGNKDKGLLLTDVVQRWSDVSSEGLFAILIVCGFSASDAYRCVYPTLASNSSVASLASRKIREEKVQELLFGIRKHYWQGDLRLRDDFPCKIRQSWLTKVEKKARRKRIFSQEDENSMRQEEGREKR